MADQVRAGIVGAGFIGAVHAHAVRAAGGVVARVAASTPERSAALPTGWARWRRPPPLRN